MTHVYDRIFEQYRILDSNNQPVKDVFSEHALWLDSPGCVIQRSDFHLPADLRTDGIMKPGLYLSIVLEGTGEGGPLDGQERQRYGENELVAMVVRGPTRCGGDAPRGSHIRAIGVAFPLPSIRALGLQRDFMDLFGLTDRSVLSMKAKAPPRIQAVAAEMLAPTIEGVAGQLLLSAQATEILARSLFVLRHRVDFEPPTGDRRVRLQAVREMMQSDLSYPWRIAELADRAGFSRRTLNMQFRAAYGVSASDYLRALRLDAAKEALIHQNLSVADVAYHVGYAHPANFATAFRRRFGCAPSHCRDQKIS